MRQRLENWAVAGISAIVAMIVWCGAVIDYCMANISEMPRSYLVPVRVFRAIFDGTAAYLTGRPFKFRSYRVRDYPPYRPR